MVDNFIIFIKHTFTYSISNILQKASGVILLPMYTAYFSPTELGIYGLLDITINILSEFLVLGLPNSIIMLNNLKEYTDSKKESLYTLFVFIGLMSVIIILIGEIGVQYIAQYFKDVNNFKDYFKISAYIIVFKMLNNLFFNKLRADENSLFYTIGNSVKLVINVGLISYFVIFLNLKVLAILYAYLISEIVLFCVFLPLIIKQIRPKFNMKVLHSSITFGFPLAFGSLASVFLNLSDRYVIKLYMDYSSVGIYEVGYRIAGVINMFFVMPMNLTLLPIAFRLYKKEGDKEYFSKILTYVTLILVWTALVLSLFSQQIINVFTIQKSYSSAYLIIPIIAFSYVFLGMRLVTTLGMYMTKNTKHIATTTIIASILNIVLNIIFIPKYGIIAAAYSTLFSFAFLYIITYRISNSYFKIRYENKKIGLILIISVILYIITLFFNNYDFFIVLILKLSIVISFPFILYFFNYFDNSEIKYVITLLKKLKIIFQK